MKSFELQSFGVQLIALAAMVNHANFASAEKGVESFQAGIDFFNYETAFREDGYPQPRDKFGPNDFGLNNFLPGEQYLNGGIAQEDIVEARNVLGLAEDNIWTRFRAKIHILNEKSPQNVQWKVVFFARHGEGYHNLASRLSTNWDEDSKHDTFRTINIDGTSREINIFDPDLTEKGVKEAQGAREYWEAQNKEDIPQPDRFYVSPLFRALRTARITFSTNEESGNFGDIFPTCGSGTCVPIITENLREMMGGRPCDKRNEYKIIRAKFPEYKFEEDFDTADMDPLWKANSIEDKSEFMDRMKRVQEKIFMETKDKATYIHLTMHDGSIRTALKVFQPLLGQREKLIDDIGKKVSAIWRHGDCGG
jgi:broad specificity phosphatase PhoE